MANIDIDEILNVWMPYLKTITNWQDLVSGVMPKQTGCGPIYELPNPIVRPNESFAIADMREIKIAEPHYHPNGETEIYVVLEGDGLVVVGGMEQQIEKGAVIVTPPDTAHFTIPQRGLVLAVINTPPFKPENYVVVTKTNPDVSFDQEQFEKLSKKQ